MATQDSTVELAELIQRSPLLESEQERQDWLVFVTKADPATFLQVQSLFTEGAKAEKEFRQKHLEALQKKQAYLKDLLLKIRTRKMQNREKRQGAEDEQAKIALEKEILAA